MKSRSALSLNRLDSNSPAYPSSIQADQRSPIGCFLRSPSEGQSPKIARAAVCRNIFPKNRSSLLTARRSGLFSQSRRKRAPKLFGVVLVLLGLQIGTQFCPGMMHSYSPRRTGCGLLSAPELSFFDARKRAATTGSLKSTYRVVNTTF